MKLTRDKLNLAQKLLLVKNIFFTKDVPNRIADAWANNDGLPVKAHRDVQLVMLGLTTQFALERFSPDIAELNDDWIADIAKHIAALAPDFEKQLDDYLDLYLWDGSKIAEIEDYWKERNVDLRTEHHLFSTDRNDPEKTRLEVWLLRVAGGNGMKREGCELEVGDYLFPDARLAERPQSTTEIVHGEPRRETNIEDR